MKIVKTERTSMSMPVTADCKTEKNSVSLKRDDFHYRAKQVPVTILCTDFQSFEIIPFNNN